jgi:hypothetical protein
MNWWKVYVDGRCLFGCNISEFQMRYSGKFGKTTVELVEPGIKNLTRV